jgi:ABC-type branched-subunit amino acid transport system substrate-binding protein
MASHLLRRTFLWGLGATGAVGLSSSCWRARTAWGAAEPIKIGLLMSFSGVVAAWGRAGRQGLKMAVEELNSQGGCWDGSS